MNNIIEKAKLIANEVYVVNNKVAFNSHLENIKSGIPKFWHPNKVKYLKYLQINIDRKYEEHKKVCKKNGCQHEIHYLNLFNNIDELKKQYNSRNVIIKYWPLVTGTIIAGLALLTFWGLNPSENKVSLPTKEMETIPVESVITNETTIMAQDSSQIENNSSINVLNNSGKIGTVIQNNKGEVQVINHFENDTIN